MKVWPGGTFTHFTDALLPLLLLLLPVDCSEELSGMLGALEGGWVAPEAGGDLLRDGPGVLPTGAAGQGQSA